MWDDSTCDCGETDAARAGTADDPAEVPVGGHGTVAVATVRMDGPGTGLEP